jgi:DNA-binding transcriptional MerR regulator
VNVQTLRYYEPRSSGGHRLYPVESVAVLRVIKAAQRLGFTLAEVAELVEAGQHRHRGRGGGLQARAADKLAEVEAKMLDLTVIRDTLRAALAAGCNDLTTCASIACCLLPAACCLLPAACCPLPFAELSKPKASS